jgi:hypothetical protein
MCRSTAPSVASVVHKLHLECVACESRRISSISSL